jgi:hypothetical protein
MRTKTASVGERDERRKLVVQRPALVVKKIV